MVPAQQELVRFLPSRHDKSLERPPRGTPSFVVFERRLLRDSCDSVLSPVFFFRYTAWNGLDGALTYKPRVTCHCSSCQARGHV